MIFKKELQQKAIALRKEGKTYGEILKSIPVAKSTLSLWLRDVGLAKKQHQTLTDKKRAAQLRGGASRKSERVVRESNIHQKAKSEVGTLSQRELWLIGVALYWAEGTKQKKHNVSQGLELINDDYRLLHVYIKWLKNIGIPQTSLVFDIYLHQASRKRSKEVIEYWVRKLALPRSAVIHTYFKRHKTMGQRRKLPSEYFGSCRIKVRASTDLNRKVDGWVKGILENCQIV